MSTGQSDSWYGDKSQSTLWQEKKPAANRLHPTMKPVELIERALVKQQQGAATACWICSADLDRR